MVIINIKSNKIRNKIERGKKKVEFTNDQIIK